MGDTPDTVFAFDDLLERLGGEIDLVREIVGVFESHAPTVISRLEHAVGSSDWEVAAREAHTLKGSAATVGASAIQATALEVERRIKGGQRDMVGECVARLARELEGFLAVAATRLGQVERDGEQPG